MAVVLTVGLAPAGGTDALAPEAAAPPPLTPPSAPPPNVAAGSAGQEAPANWFEAWKLLKKDLENTTGTTFTLTLDDTQMFVLNGPGENHERNLFWWNLTVTQKLWTDAKLVARVRGSNETRHNEPPHGFYPLIRPKINLDWRWGETEWIYLANLYVEQRLLDKKLLIVVGKLMEGTYFDNNKATGDFLSYSLMKNLAFPHRSHTLGAVVRYDPTKWVYVQAGAIDAQGMRSETGFQTAFHKEDYFLSEYEVGFVTKWWGREGNWRFNLWHDPTRLSRHDGRGTKHDTIGFGVSFDHEITDKITAFFRYGVTDGDVRTFGNTWSLGGTIKGLLPGREQDVLGIGFVQGITDHSYQDHKNGTASESLFEGYYKIKVTDWCWLYPDVQVLLNPGTNAANDVSVIAGLRLKMEF